MNTLPAQSHPPAKYGDRVRALRLEFGTEDPTMMMLMTGERGITGLGNWGSEIGDWERERSERWMEYDALR